MFEAPEHRLGELEQMVNISWAEAAAAALLEDKAGAGSVANRVAFIAPPSSSARQIPVSLVSTASVPTRISVTTLSCQFCLSFTLKEDLNR